MLLSIPLPPGVRARDLSVTLLPSRVTIGIKGLPPYMDQAPFDTVVPSESIWTVEDGVLEISLAKAHPGRPWEAAMAGHEGADPDAAAADRKRLLLERFQAENPGFDFSGAEINGEVPSAETFLKE